MLRIGIDIGCTPAIGDRRSLPAGDLARREAPPVEPTEAATWVEEDPRPGDPYLEYPTVD